MKNVDGEVLGRLGQGAQVFQLARQVGLVSTGENDLAHEIDDEGNCATDRAETDAAEGPEKKGGAVGFEITRELEIGTDGVADALGDCAGISGGHGAGQYKRFVEPMARETPRSDAGWTNDQRVWVRTLKASPAPARDGWPGTRWRARNSVRVETSEAKPIQFCRSEKFTSTVRSRSPNPA